MIIFVPPIHINGRYNISDTFLLLAKKKYASTKFKKKIITINDGFGQTS